MVVIGATNRPDELDEAARRRFVKVSGVCVCICVFLSVDAFGAVICRCYHCVELILFL